MSYFVIAMRVLIAGAFAVAAISKLSSTASLAAFERSLRRIGAVPASMLRPATGLVVTGEMVVPVLLLWPSTITIGFAVAAAMLAAFAIAVAVSMRRGLREPCRCFGASRASLGALHLWRNLALLASSATAAVLHEATSATPETGRALLAIALGVVALVVLLLLEDIAAVFGTATSVATPAPGRRSIT
jgi:hypothetical protein